MCGSVGIADRSAPAWIDVSFKKQGDTVLAASMYCHIQYTIHPWQSHTQFPHMWPRREAGGQGEGLHVAPLKGIGVIPCQLNCQKERDLISEPDLCGTLRALP